MTRDSFERILLVRFFLSFFPISYFVFLLSNRCILSLAAEKHRNFPKSIHSRERTLRLFISNFGDKTTHLRVPVHQPSFSSPSSSPPCSSSPPVVPKSASKRRDASARASFHCGCRAFPATFVRPRQGRTARRNCRFILARKLEFSFFVKYNSRFFCLN